MNLDLFATTPPTFARARVTDPVSSHKAAADMERTGRAKAQAERVLAAIRRFPGSTSAELSKSAHIERYATARRLPELLKAGAVTRADPGEHTVPCVVSGKRVCRWYPA